MYGRWPAVDKKSGDATLQVEYGNRYRTPDGSAVPLSGKSQLVSTTHPFCGCILALLASKNYQSVFWSQVSPAEHSMVYRCVVFCYVIS